MRSSKTVNNVTTTFHYNGSLLMAQVQGSGASQVKQLYSYDANGDVVSVNYNGTEYYYLRNGQTDIVGLMDASGNRVVEYIYDAWGKLISTTGTLATSLGADNPFRYRGYYYDTETGLYYLMTRYYDPEVCRFISADVYMTTGQGVLGGNMWAYCGNNPVNRYDNGGEFWHIVIGAAAGALINAAVSAVSQGIENGWDNINWGEVGVAAATGALGGALTASGVGLAGQIAGSAAIAAAGNAAQQISDIGTGKQDRFDVGSMLLDATIGGICGAISGPGASAVPGTGGQKQMINLGKSTVKRTANAIKHGGVKQGIKEATKAAKYYLKSTAKNTKALFSVRVGISQLVNAGHSIAKALIA